MVNPAQLQLHSRTLCWLAAALFAIGLVWGLAGPGAAHASLSAKAAKKSSASARCKKAKAPRSTRRTRSRVKRCRPARRAPAPARQRPAPAAAHAPTAVASAAPAAASLAPAPPSAPPPGPPTTPQPPQPPKPPTPQPPPPPSPTGLRIGLNADTQGWGSQMGARQDAAATSGAKWLREEFDWSVIEPARGQWDWSRYDQLQLNAAQRGFTVLPVLMDTPAWAGSTWSTIPADPADYAEFVAKVTARYGPGGSFWLGHPELATRASEYFELWNEPYYPFFSNNRIDPGRYARLVKAGAGAGRAANPLAKFVMASETDVLPTGSSNWVSWTDALYAAVPDLNDYFDAVAVHPYSKTYAPDAPTDGYIHDKFQRIETIRQHFADHGGSAKPFWITEVGWSTCSDPGQCVSESTQSAYTSKLFSLVRSSYSYVQAVFLYRSTDLGPSDSANPEADYGLTHQDGSAKPVWNLLKSVTGAA